MLNYKKALTNLYLDYYQQSLHQDFVLNNLFNSDDYNALISLKQYFEVNKIIKDNFNNEINSIINPLFTENKLTIDIAKHILKLTINYYKKNFFDLFFCGDILLKLSNFFKANKDYENHIVSLYYAAKTFINNYPIGYYDYISNIHNNIFEYTNFILMSGNEALIYYLMDSYNDAIEIELLLEKPNHKNIFKYYRIINNNYKNIEFLQKTDDTLANLSVLLHKNNIKLNKEESRIFLNACENQSRLHLGNVYQELLNLANFYFAKYYLKAINIDILESYFDMIIEKYPPKYNEVEFDFILKYIPTLALINSKKYLPIAIDYIFSYLNKIKNAQTNYKIDFCLFYYILDIFTLFENEQSRLIYLKRIVEKRHILTSLHSYIGNEVNKVIILNIYELYNSFLGSNNVINTKTDLINDISFSYINRYVGVTSLIDHQYILLRNPTDFELKYFNKYTKLSFFALKKINYTNNLFDQLYQIFSTGDIKYSNKTNLIFYQHLFDIFEISRQIEYKTSYFNLSFFKFSTIKDLLSNLIKDDNSLNKKVLSFIKDNTLINLKLDFICDKGKEKLYLSILNHLKTY